MQQIIVKTNNATQAVNQTQVVTKSGQPAIIKASHNANYEFIKETTGRAPDHVITKRVGKDLHVSFEEMGQESDLIIEQFYDYKDSALIGQAENGQYYYYIPDTGEVADYVTQLSAGAVEGQALGGQSLASPWWVASGFTSAGWGGFGTIPWVVGSVGSVAAVAKNQSNKRGAEEPRAHISIEMVAKDDVVNVDERNTIVDVVGAVSGYYTPGDIVTLVINGKTYTGAVGANGLFSIPVPAEELAQDSDLVIEASVAATHPVGNFTATTLHPYRVEDIPTNNPPTAQDDVAAVEYQTATTIDVLANDTDPDNDPLTITDASVPANQGTVAIVGNELVFTPADGFVGDATISYTISDGKDTSSATVTATVAAAPVVSIAGDAQVNEGEQATYTVSLDKAASRDVVVQISFVNGSANDQDVSGVPVSVTIPAGQTQVVFDIEAIADQLTEGDEDYQIQITDATNAALGTNSVTTTIVDTSTTPAPGNQDPTVTVTVTIAPEQGKAQPGQQVATSDGNDPEGEPLTYSLTPGSDPEGYYAIDPQDGTVTLTPKGADHVNAGGDLPPVQVTVTDPQGGTGSDNDNTVPATIVDVNNPPTAQDDVAAVEYQTATTIDVLANDTDPDNDPLTITDASVPANQGTVAIVGNELVFTPADGFVGDATISYTISDGKDTSSATVTATVAAAPVVSIAGDAQVNEGEQATYTVSLDKAASRDVEVVINFNLTGSAGPDDVKNYPTTVVIPAGQTSVSFTADIVADNLTEGAETYAVGIASVVGGNDVARISSQNRVSTEIKDTSTTPVTPTPAPTTAPVVKIVLDDNPDNGYLVAREVGKNTTTDVTITVPNDAHDGDVITVVDGAGKELTTYIVGQSGVTAGSVQTITVNIPAHGERLTVTATLSNAQGEISGNDTTLVDTKAGINNNIHITAISDDTGTPDDFTTTDQTLVILGTLDKALESSEFVEVSLNGGQSFVRATVDGTNWTLDATGTTLPVGTYNVVARIIDAHRNIGPETNQEVVVQSSGTTPIPVVAPEVSLAGDTQVNEGEQATYTVSLDKAA
ncbi:MAG: Ig-like domain-containing protein, partial [Moraxella sp.]|nr:Ig-like domain-containing protein [Moraxella sp.]